MTLFQIIQTLKQIALTQPNIKSATDGSIYEVMNTNPSVKYDVVHFSQTTHQSDEETDYYGLNIFYVSRLEDSLEDNRLQIQSIGKEVLDNIIRTFCENWNIDFPVITYTPFTQKFNDLCAGCYCNLRLEIPKEIICADDFVAEVVPGSGIKLQDIGITITQNGLIVITPDAEYDGIGEIRIQTEVPQSAAVLQDKEVEYTENGSYTVHPDPAYDGLSSVSVDVLVPDNYDEGYDDGKRDGENEQKAKLTVTSFTENNTYTRADGWSAVTVDVPSDYQDGYDDGAADQKAKLVPTAITENGTYSREDGYSSIEVNVPIGEDRYNEGYLDGMNYQKSLLIETAFTENGGYARENGYSVVYVNVPQTGYTQEDLDEAYQRGFEDGMDTCTGSPTVATSITINVADSIVDSGTATTTVNPYSATTNLQYSSSDSSKATINATTGVITVVGNGAVVFCVVDTITGLQSCKTVNVVKSGVDCKVLNFVYLTTAPNEEVIFYDTVNLPASTNFERAASNSTRDWVNNLCSMEIDGVVMPATSAYTFEMPGKHIVKYNSPVGTVPDYLFSLTKNPHPTSNAQNEKLVEAHIGEGFGVLLNNAFDGDTNLTAVTLPNTMIVLGKYPFRNTGISSIVIPDTVTANTSITDYRPYVNRYVLNSEDAGWFSGCTNLSSVTMSTGSTIVPPGCFASCTSLSSITLPNNITRICDSAFKENLSLTGVTIPNSLTGIGLESFRTTSLVDTITLPDTVKELGAWAFTNARNVRTFIFGTGITKIDTQAFYYTPVTTIVFNGDIPPVLGNESALGSKSKEGFIIYVPASAVDTYKSAWPYYENNITAKP